MRAKKTPTKKRPKPCKLVLTGKPDLRIITYLPDRVEITFRPRPTESQLEDRQELLRD
jgi:hypothetical protein